MARRWLGGSLSSSCHYICTYVGTSCTYLVTCCGSSFVGTYMWFGVGRRKEKKKKSPQSDRLGWRPRPNIPNSAAAALCRLALIRIHIYSTVTFTFALHCSVDTLYFIKSRVTAICIKCMADGSG